MTCIIADADVRVFINQGIMHGAQDEPHYLHATHMYEVSTLWKLPAEHVHEHTGALAMLLKSRGDVLCYAVLAPSTY